MSDTCERCGRPKGISFNDIDAYKKCLGGPPCMERAYEREKARADQAEAREATLAAANAALADSVTRCAGIESDLAAARGECEGLKALLREAQIALSTVGCIPEGEQHAQEVLRKLEAALAAPAAGEEKSNG